MLFKTVHNTPKKYVYQRSSSDLGLESLDKVPASGPLVLFTSLSTDDDDDGKGVK